MALYASAKATESNSTSEELHKTYRDQIEHKSDLINKKIIFIAPRIRFRRGIINGLGSIVKAITGNLDNEDAIRFESEINKIRNSVYKTQSSQRRTLSLAESTTKEFSKQLSKIDDNQKRLTSILKNITINSDTIKNQLHFLEIYVQISFSLQIILDKLMVLEDAMAFSQLGIMHPSIISPRNLILELSNLQDNFSLYPAEEISIDNIHKIEKSISVKAYSTEHSLTFILEIPSVQPILYDYIHIYSLPNNLNLTIIPKSKFLALGSDEYAYLEEDCKKLSEDTWLCKSLDTRAIEKSEDCIISLIKHKDGNCTQARMNLKRGKLQKIKENKWLVVSTESEIIKTQCGQKTEYRKLSGTFFINLTQDCQVKIMNTTIRTHTSSISMDEVIPLPNENLINQEEVQYEIHLEDISLDSVYELMNKVEDIQEIENWNWSYIMAIPSWSTVLLYILAASIAIWKIYNWNKRSSKASREDAPGSCRTSFQLKEGRVNVS
ncbi:unnamed protein product [Parnassius mnemosyne]|uniref:Envelope protein n=1 Tax=Parnassius mnemosyne TaxID=213953 RepID=A0AAV1L7C7_9NEOP